MELKAYWETLDAAARRQFAKRAGTNVVYLSQLVHKHRRPSADLAKAISKASGDQIPLAKLRPDIWAGAAH